MTDLRDSRNQTSKHKRPFTSRSDYDRNPNRCLQCGDPIQWEKRLKVKCCSKVCAGFLRSGSNYSKKNPKTCPQCSTPITVHGSVHCSSKCQRHSEWIDYRESIRKAGVAPFSRSAKRFLAEENGLKCSICDIEEWRGEPISLILDHINGHASDIRLNNLRLVCHNCDAQLPTYKGRNKGNGRHSRRQRYADGKSY